MPAVLIPVLALLAGAAGSAWGQAGIYTCVDAGGKRITSDRPIVECLDREQKELNPTGTVRRIVPPSLTATERVAQEERDRKAAEERLRAGEDRRMQRALLTRYPNPEVHDSEREKALQAQQEVVDLAQRRVQALRDQRAKLDAEAESHKAAEWPARLKQQLDENDQQLKAQQRYAATQQDELKRITRRFDEELARLKLLWAQRDAATAAGPPAAAVPAAR